MIEIDENEYKKKPIPTFCYAGVFYDKIRNPQFFLEYLSGLTEDFKFIVYVLPNEFSLKLLALYREKLKGKTEIRNPLEMDWIFVVCM